MAGTNFFEQSDFADNIQVDLTDESGLITLGKGIGVFPTTTNRFQKGCILIKTDAPFGISAAYENSGSVSNPVWTLIGTGGGGGVQSVTGLNTDNTDPLNPIVKISIDSTLTGDGTPGNPLGVTPPYVGPTTTLATSPVGGLREKGNTSLLGSIDLSSTTTKNSDPITTFTYSKTGAGVIFTDPTPNPNGGVEMFTDAVGIPFPGTNTTYTATVGDGTSTGTATVTFSFAFTYYFGVASPGLDISVDGGGLTKLLQNNTASTLTITSPTNQVYYFCYPDSYPALTSILDNSGFETIADYTVTTGIVVTNSFGESTTYRKYEFNNLTTQVNFHNTYKE